MKTLQVWLKAGHTVEIIRRLVPEFIESSGIDVDIRVVPEHTAHDSLVNGEARPDIVTVPYWYLDELNDLGILLPLSISDFEMEEAAFVPAALETLKRKGSIWAVPHTLTGGMLSYRRDVFEQHRIAPPKTLTEVLRSSELLEPHGGGLAARCNEEFSSLETFAGWAAARGIKLLPNEGNPCREDVLHGIGDLVRALRANARVLPSMDYAAMGDLIVKGLASQLFDTSAWAFQFEAPDSPVRGKMAYTTIGDSAPAQFLYAEGLGITQWCTNSSAAHRFIAWRQSERVLRAEMEEVRRLDLPRQDLRRKEWFIHYIESQRLTEPLLGVDQSWSHIDLSHVAMRPDFVDASRRLMGAITGTITGHFASLDEAYDVIYGMKCHRESRH